MSSPTPASPSTSPSALEEARALVERFDDLPPEAIFKEDMLRRIGAGDPEWESMVPPEIADVIRKRRFFGYREPLETTLPA